MTDFSKYENQWIITGVITTESGLKIGGGQNAAAYSLSSSPVVQSYDSERNIYLPMLPGSSLKGIIRSGMERLIRSFNEQKSCVALNNKREYKTLCGACITCDIFGSMQHGAKIRVEDAHVHPEDAAYAVSAPLYYEQPHYGRLPNFPKNKGLFRSEEVVAAGTRFNLSICLDNAKPAEVGLVLLTLEEFNEKRLQIGGATSRGLGFVSLTELQVMKRSLNPGGRITEIPEDSAEIRKAGKNYLKSIDSGEDNGSKDFSVYASAHSDLQSGSVFGDGYNVVQMRITTQKPFQMAGFEEPTITSHGEPYIPGSTIKGFLRKQYAQKYGSERTITLFSGGSRGIRQQHEPSHIDEIFGNSESHRSRILVSDAFAQSTIACTDEIPAGTVLSMWMVFDNMDRKDIEKIIELLKEPVIITGAKSAGISSSRDRGPRRGPYQGNARQEPTHNKVKIEVVPGSVRVFRTQQYLKDR